MSDTEIVDTMTQAEPAADLGETKLDSIISKVLDGEAAEAPPADESAAPADDRARDEKGRFAPKTDTQEPPALDSKAPEAPVNVSTEAKPPETQPEPAKPDVPEGHFRGWSPEARAKFQALPPEAQEVALALKKETDAHYTGKLMEAADFRKTAEPALKALSQSADVFAANGLDPVQAINGYAAIERVLTFGTFNQKLGLIGEICNKYRIPFAADAIMERLDPAQAERLPMVHDHNAEMARIKAENARIQRELDSYQHSQLQSHVEAFKSATNADGSPKHPHFETVKLAMGGLLRSGQASSIEEAYALAARPIDEAIAAQAAAATRAAEEKNRSAVERAKKAQPVKVTAAVPAGKTVGKGGLDAVLGSALDAAGFA